MRAPDRISPSVLLVLAVALVTTVAYASNINRSKADTATTARYCTSTLPSSSYNVPPPRLGVQCELEVLIATGTKLSDAGIRRTSDAGALVPDRNDELIKFPGDPWFVQLGRGENCIGVLSADAGTNSCRFFESNDP